MAKQLSQILPNGVDTALQAFDELYSETLATISPTLNQAHEQLLKSRGKALRPTLLILVAMNYGNTNERTYLGSLFVELLHLATLIHDDVVDESLERRGKPSLNAIFGNKKSVLIGDFILAKAIEKAWETKCSDVFYFITRLGADLSEGELLQLDTAELGNYSIDAYYQIINRKTAALMQTTIEIGAILSGEENHTNREKLARAALNFGQAFQIKDDIFDYKPTKNLGKPAGQDLLEGKVTLPLLLALQKRTNEGEKVIKLLRKKNLSQGDLRFITDFTIRLGGIEAAERVMWQHLETSKQLFEEVLRPNPYLYAILELCDYVGEREK